MHRRIFPKENVFTYSVYYLALPLPASPIPGKLISFYPKDLGYRDGSDPEQWARSLLTQYGIEQGIEQIVLITMPRVLGYLFNPVSFYLCLDEDNQLRSVICEVHNTFGEQHAYLCARPDHLTIDPSEWLEAEKLFHVSPFLERLGTYRFKFDFQMPKLGIWIDYYDHSKQKQLITSLIGACSPLDSGSIRQAFWTHPLITLKTITLIHWQAIRLFFKGMRYITKPFQLQKKVSSTCDVNPIENMSQEKRTEEIRRHDAT